MKMPKAWLMLASALNLQLGWGAKWKDVEADLTCIFLLHLTLESRVLRYWGPHYKKLFYLHMLTADS